MPPVAPSRATPSNDGRGPGRRAKWFPVEHWLACCPAYLSFDLRSFDPFCTRCVTPGRETSPSASSFRGGGTVVRVVLPLEARSLYGRADFPIATPVAFPRSRSWSAGFLPAEAGVTDTPPAAHQTASSVGIRARRNCSQSRMGYSMTCHRGSGRARGVVSESSQPLTSSAQRAVSCAARYSTRASPQ